MRKYKREILILLPTLGLIALLFVFQNCANSVQLGPAVVKALNYVSNIQSSLCSDSRVEPPGKNNKFVFIVDMSASNIGGWKAKIPTVCPNCFWFDPTQATDPLSSRLNAIQTFVSDQQSHGVIAQYSVVGFSDSAGSVVYDNTGTIPTGLSCDLTQANSPKFVADPSTSITALKNIQSTTAASPWYTMLQTRYYLATDAASQPPIMRATNYVNALNCAQNVIANDITKTNDPTISYRIFFLSDGAPDDGNSSCGTITDPAAKQLCYSNEIKAAKAGLWASTATTNNDLTIYGIFYSQSTTTCADPTSPTCQTYFMNQLTGSGLIQIAGSTFDSSTLTGLLNQSLSIRYEPDSFGFINMNVVNRKGKILLDSSASGLPDDDKDKLCLNSNLKKGCLNYNDPRSIGKFGMTTALPILDGVCAHLAGGVKDSTTIAAIQASCITAYNAVTCLSTRHNRLGYDNLDGFGWHGLNDCDIKVLGLDQIGSPLPYVDLHTSPQPVFDPCTAASAGCTALNQDFNLGIDSDGDGLPDYIEIVKNTDPSTSDSNVDTDGDGTTNSQEIQLGRDPTYPDSDMAASLLNKFNFNLQNNMCSASGAASGASKNLNGYVLNIQKLQSPVTDSSTPLTQKIFIYYRITPQNSSHIVSEYYGLFLDVTQTVSDNNIILTPVTVYNGVTGLPQPITNPSSVLNQFSLMGKVAR